MTLAAESLAGRVLAVLSRRSPGFRPPLTPSEPLAHHDSSVAFGPTSMLATASRPGFDGVGPTGHVPQARGAERDSVVGPTLADATARWKSVSPHERLQRREDLLELAEVLKAVHRDAEALARALDNVLALFRERTLFDKRALLRNFDRADARGVADACAFTLDRALERVLADARARDLDLGPAVALALVRALTLERDLERANTRAGRLAVDRARDRAFVRARDRARELDRDLDEAHDNLTDAANSFVGADLTAVDPAQVDLAWIRWNNDTRWPTPGWADRIRRASVEQPPGSGIFVVLPEEDRDSAEVTLA